MLNNTILNSQDFALAGMGGLVGGALVTLILVFLLILVFSYVYFGFAFMSIAKKTKQSNPGIAWIPWVGPLIITFRTSKMHWWPWILLIGLIIPVGVGSLFLFAFEVIAIFWYWKMFKAVGRPGWWAILNLIPIVNYILIGFAAWGKSKKEKYFRVVSKKKSTKKRR